MPYIELEAQMNPPSLGIKSTGDGFSTSPSEPVPNDPRLAVARLKHLYMLYIALDGDEICVRKFIKKNCNSDFAAAERELLALAINPNSTPNWPDEVNGASLAACDFQGAGRFVIVLGNPKWRFYDRGMKGHTAINFLPQKVYVSANLPFKETVLPGSFNRGIIGGQVDTIGNLPVYRCANYLLDEFGDHLKPDESRPVIFDINIEIPIKGTNNYALIVIDPGGRNTGP